MIGLALALVAIAAGYLLGAIPFGYYLALWLRGVDVRTVGSGNIGATNVGRVLGFRYFWLVFAFDLSKGLLPTWAFPAILARLTGQPVAPELPVLVGLAAILGHNYPIYLGFKGGKGVATSLGAMFALDPIASLVSAATFVVCLLICRYVSLSALIGAGGFAVAHFARVSGPWERDQRAMTIVTIGLVLMMIVRHRKNLSRIRKGTEPKVPLRRGRSTPPREEPPMSPTASHDQPRGRIAAAWLVVLALIAAVGVGAAMGLRAVDRREVLRIGPYTLREVDRAATGHQRAERVAFARDGELLVVTCPRYQRLVLYHVPRACRLQPFRDLELDGTPVAIATHADRLYVLERPAGDRRHVEPGWIDCFDLEGNRVGERHFIGFYPDDLALSRDGRHLLVLTSGRGEGDAGKPAPAVQTYEIDPVGHAFHATGRVAFESRNDDPARLTLSESGRCAVVTLPGSNSVAALDLSDPNAPRLAARSALPDLSRPYPSRTGDDCIIMPVAGGNESVLVTLSGHGSCVVSTIPRGSALELVDTHDRKILGRLPLRSGALGLSQTRPTGVAYSPDRGLLAVANRSGGVHLLVLQAMNPAIAANTRAE